MNNINIASQVLSTILSYAYYLFSQIRDSPFAIKIPHSSLLIPNYF